MIQRIQSVYLFLAFLSGVVLFFFPIAWYYGEVNTLEFFVCRIVDHVPSNVPLFGKYFLLPLSALNLVSALFSFFLIFLYKKLNRQYKLIRLNILLIIIYIGAVFFYYSDNIGSVVNSTAQFGVGAFLPLISLVFLVLAMRGINSDIKLLRSVDRLR
jgi:hypothetical protein